MGRLELVVLPFNIFEDTYPYVFIVECDYDLAIASYQRRL
jgi:hypothetical protein